MTSPLYLKNGTIVNESRIFKGNILIEAGRIIDIFENTSGKSEIENINTINLEGMHILPGVIDSHVHFRQPGLTHKADMFTESKAAIAGGVTSILEMPNTNPQTVSIKNLEDKIKLAEDNCLTNFAFFLGATNDNIDEILSADPSYIPGIKVFMGASTGNMLVDNNKTLTDIFSKVKMIIAVHCEDEEIIYRNLSKAKAEFADDIPFYMHPVIRSREACYKSTKEAVDLAVRFNSRLHILHISTKEESELLEKVALNSSKQITGEACVHHLWFTDKDYSQLKSLIKWNPAIKSADDRLSLIENLKNNRIDVISTDHAPHTFEEKQQPYLTCPSGAPLVQHSLPAMLELYHRNQISLEMITEKMCHNPARCFNIKGRGYIRKGYIADLTVVDMNSPWKVDKSNIMYKCGWSPLEGNQFKSKVIHTFVNGTQIYNNGVFQDYNKGALIRF